VLPPLVAGCGGGGPPGGEGPPWGGAAGGPAALFSCGGGAPAPGPIQMYALVLHLVSFFHAFFFTWLIVKNYHNPDSNYFKDPHTR
jgi:hypothetical protein